MDDKYTNDELLTSEDSTIYENEVLMGDESLRLIDDLLRNSFLKMKEQDQVVDK